MQQNTIDYSPRRHQTYFRLALDIGAVVGVLCAAIWFVKLSYGYHHGADYSNRDFAGPAAVTSLVLSTWFAVRMVEIPLVVRIVVFPFGLIAGYATIGLGMIFLNAGLR